MAMIFKLSFRNIFRNKKRTVLTLSTIFVTVCAFILALGWIGGIFNMWIDNTVRFAYGHIKIAHKEYLKKERMLPLHFSINNLEQVIENVQKNPNVVLVKPRIKFGAQLEFNEKTADCLGMAVDTTIEKNSTKIAEFIVKGSYWDDSETGTEQGIMIGIKTAEELGVDVGDEVSVLSRTADFSPYLLVYKIRAIYKSGMTALDKGMFYINLADAGELLNLTNAASEILIMIKDRDQAKKVAAVIQKSLDNAGFDHNLKVVAWQDQGAMGKMLRMSNVFFVLLLLIISVVAGLTILNTMLMAVFERTNEIGMMRALGMQKGKVLTLIITESLAIAVIGGIIGIIIGANFSYFFFEKVGIDISKAMETASGWYFDPIMRADFKWIHCLYSFLYGLLLSSAAAVYPAYRASKMRPVQALRIV